MLQIVANSGLFANNYPDFCVNPQKGSWPCKQKEAGSANGALDRVLAEYF